MNVQLIEAGQKLQAKRTELAGFYTQFDKKGDANAPDMTASDVEKFHTLNDEVNDLAKGYEGLKKVYDAAEANRQAMAEAKNYAPTPGYQQQGLERQVKSLGQLAYEAKIGANREKDFNFEEINSKGFLGLESKATMTTSANGYTPEVIRDGNVVSYPSRPPQLIELLRIDPTTQNAIKFMAQTVRTNAAAGANEGSALAESTITYAEQTDIISRIGTFIPVTEEQIEDVGELDSLVNMDLSLMVRQELDRQITVGDGSDPTLLGIYNGGSIQTQARGSDPVLDAILKAMEKITTVARANPGVIVMHGTDHTNLALTRTADGVYLLGNPTDVAVNRVWGLPIARSEALTATNMLVLDPFYFRVKLRKGVTLAVSNSHASNFTSNILVIRAHVRAGIQRLREAAACKVTGL